MEYHHRSASPPKPVAGVAACALANFVQSNAEIALARSAGSGGEKAGAHDVDKRPQARRQVFAGGPKNFEAAAVSAVGAVVSGWFIDALGLRGCLLCGALFAALAVMTVTARLRFYRQVTAALSGSSP